jgi:hypothetical protein
MIVAITVEAAALRWRQQNCRRFPRTRVHRTPGGGYDLLFRMPLPPVPILQCTYGKLARGVDVLGDGGHVLWPAPAPYRDVTPGCEVVLEAPITPLPGWIIERVLASPRQKRPGLRLPAAAFTWSGDSSAISRDILDRALGPMWCSLLRELRLAGLGTGGSTRARRSI